MSRRLVCIAGLLLVTVAGCSSPARPDLAWMYGASGGAEPPPLVIIPGLMGSRLIDKKSGREVWPGSVWGLMFRNHRRLALPLEGYEPASADLVPGGLTDYVAGRDFYRSIVDTLESAA